MCSLVAFFKCALKYPERANSAVKLVHNNYYVTGVYIILLSKWNGIIVKPAWLLFYLIYET